LSKSGKINGRESIDGKSIGLFFSANWCPTCREFTPDLIKTYEKVKKENEEFEIVFVSRDFDEQSFADYFGEMPWLALPFSDRLLKASVSKKYGVSGIPSLILLNPDGSVITIDGRASIDDDDIEHLLETGEGRKRKGSIEVSGELHWHPMISPKSKLGKPTGSGSDLCQSRVYGSWVDLRPAVPTSRQKAEPKGR
jgi:thiol-disulfide isomerase/thioredoxin